MAIEEAEEPAEKAEEAPKKKATSKVAILAVIAVLLLALLGVGGFLVYKLVLTGGGGEGGHEGGAPAAEKGGEKLGDIMPLDAFIVNISGEAGKRYLKVTMNLELSSAELTSEISNKMPQIKDSIITVLSAKTSEELLSIEGKFKLKEQILTRMNNFLTTGVVKNLYFVEFVIQ